MAWVMKEWGVSHSEECSCFLSQEVWEKGVRC